MKNAVAITGVPKLSNIVTDVEELKVSGFDVSKSSAFANTVEDYFLQTKKYEKTVNNIERIAQEKFHPQIRNNTLLSIYKNLLLFGGSLLWLASSVAGFYHFGIEMSFWNGPDGCSSNIDFSKDTLTYLLNKSPIKCNEIMIEILGLSLAGWNALASFFIFLLAIILLFNKRHMKI